MPPSPSTGEILRLLQLIQDTKIPDGHKEIIVAIRQYFDFPGAEKWAREISETIKSILAQKPMAARKYPEKKRNLDSRARGQ